MSTQDNIPPGFTLRHTLQGHENTILRLIWSRDGRTLASTSVDKTIRLWNPETGELIRTLEGHHSGVNHVAWSLDGHTLASCSIDRTIRIWDTATGKTHRRIPAHNDDIPCIAWSPDGHTLASCSADRTIKLWHTYTWELLRLIEGHNAPVLYVAWSPDGKKLASSSEDSTIRLWDPTTGKLQWTLEGHTKKILCVAWSANNRTLASASYDKTVRIWDTDLAQQAHVLKGHSSYVRSVSFSSDAQLLASNSPDGKILLWHTSNWRSVATLPEFVAKWWVPGLAFHPDAPVLATLGEYDSVIHIWDLDVAALLGTVPTTPSVLYSDKEQLPVTSSVHYINAKVALVGDSGVGKSGLGLVLSGQEYVPTDSTHARHVWMFGRNEVELDGGRKETREILLWDLAGQPGYRLIHQLHLNGVAVALVVIDARSETDPFAGVLYWERALRQARRIEGSSTLPLKKFLVAARADRGGIGVSQERIQALMQGMDFDRYFETSAKKEWQIAELQTAIREAIDWETLPKVSSTELFQQIKNFLVKQKEAGRLLSTIDDLYAVFLAPEDAPAESEDLRAQFETCIGRVESAGLIKRLSFGKLVLLQPELLDAYTSALVNAVKDEPEGWGSITEERVRKGDFRMPEDERIEDREQEKWLLIAMVEDLLQRELALREEPFLIFPSQSTRENPDLPNPEGKAVTFAFEGPVLNIYTTLAVRLSYSELFKKKALWKNAITYTANVGGTCGMFLHNIGEGRDELTLFFDKTASEETKFNFENYVYVHLQHRALPESVKQRRIFVCPKCGEPFTDSQVRRRREAGFNSIRCVVCDTQVSILDGVEQLIARRQSVIQEMNRAADIQRDRQADISTLEGKRKTGDFDVFLCHNSEDKPQVKRIGELLKGRGILPWLDEWELQPGLLWQVALEQQIKQIKSTAVFVGKNGTGPWQDLELYAFLRQFVKRRCPVIPVILSESEQTPKLPVFLEGMIWVDFRRQDPEPIEQLMWGITGEHYSI